MAPLVRIRGWRARRRDRKDAELIGLAALSPTDGADAKGVQERVRDDWWKGQVVELGDWDPGGHAGEEGRPAKH
jgi:hypothetical protein